MKKSKILVPAVALLALSTVAATTGTVAWFTTNTTVTASFLNVGIASSQDLRISDTFSPYNWTTSLNWTHTNNSLVPVTPVAGTLTETTKLLKDVTDTDITADPIFLSPNLANNPVDPATGKATNEPIANGNNSTNYMAITENAYLGEDFALKYEGSKYVDNNVVTSETVKGKVTFTGSDLNGKEIDKALRLAVYSITDRKFDVYNVANNVLAKTYTVNLKNITLESGEPKQYRVFVYYEGSDAACKNINAITNPIGVNFEFSLASKAA